MFDASGNLYGTTNGGGFNDGTVFKLTPVTGGWKETVLYRFAGAVNNDGQYPYAGLISDAKGNLYGTTYYGGKYSCGTVFELSKKSGSWVETNLHVFTGHPDGCGPYAGLARDSQGALYGTTVYMGAVGGAGTVFKLTPPATAGGAWKETVLHTFGLKSTDGSSPYSNLIFDSAGALYGTTSAGGTGSKCGNGGPCGTVFKLTPPKTSGGTWSEHIIYNFPGPSKGAYPNVGVIFDAHGNLYGTTLEGGSGTACPFGCGTVFELTPNGTGWTQKVLHNFMDSTDGAWPLYGLVMDSTGVLYGTTTTGGGSSGCTGTAYYNGCGTVFKLTPPATTGGTWTEKTLYVFTNATDGASPAYGSLVLRKGKLYGNAMSVYPAYQMHGYLGDVFEITP